jgi:hypothetical protein
MNGIATGIIQHLIESQEPGSKEVCKRVHTAIFMKPSM